MYDELTEQDIKKMEEEIEYRKLMRRRKIKTRTRAASAIWSG